MVHRTGRLFRWQSFLASIATTLSSLGEDKAVENFLNSIDETLRDDMRQGLLAEAMQSLAQSSCD
jgi:hypothetical protein